MDLPSKKIRDKRGKKFNKLTVIEFSGLNSRGKATWLCVCECGKEKIVNAGSLKSGNTSSCGCMHIIGSKANRKYSETTKNLYYGNHKRRGDAEKYGYLSKDEWWSVVNNPCHYCNKSETKKRYHNYTNNLMKLLPEDVEKYQIDFVGVDRIDSNKGYTIDNCLPCCAICNRMKMESNYDDFLNQMILILKNLGRI